MPKQKLLLGDAMSNRLTDRRNKRRMRRLHRTQVSRCRRERPCMSVHTARSSVC